MVRQLSNKQLEEVKRTLEQQKCALQEAENMREEERERAAEAIRKKEEALTRERREREMLAAQLKAMEEKVVVGSADVQEARKKEEELVKAQIELEERRREQERAVVALREQEENEMQMEEKYNTLQEEAAAKTKKLKKLWNRYEQVRGEVEDIQKENQQQKEDLLQTIRDNDVQIKLMNTIIDSFVPEEERSKIEDHCTWDDEAVDWTVAHQHLTGTVVRREHLIPGKKVGNSRTSPMFGGEEPESDDLTMSNPNIPNAYFSYPASSGAPIQQAVENEGTERSQAGRPKSRSRASSAKRPTSAMKGTRSKDESAIKSQFLSFDEAQQAQQMQQQQQDVQGDFPEAKGLGMGIKRP